MTLSSSKLSSLRSAMGSLFKIETLGSRIKFSPDVGSGMFSLILSSILSSRFATQPFDHNCFSSSRLHF